MRNDPDAVVERAVLAGATETLPVADEHSGCPGRIVDPFGHEWEIGQPLGAWPPTYAASHQAGGGVRNRDAPAAINIVAPP